MSDDRKPTPGEVWTTTGGWLERGNYRAVGPWAENPEEWAWTNDMGVVYTAYPRELQPPITIDQEGHAE